MIMSKEGTTYADVDLVRLSFDTFLASTISQSTKLMENACCDGCGTSVIIKANGIWMILRY